MKPYKCPVCKGRGEVKKNFYGKDCDRECKSCNGRGFVWDSSFDFTYDPLPYIPYWRPMQPWYDDSGTSGWTAYPSDCQAERGAYTVAASDEEFEMAFDATIQKYGCVLERLGDE